MKVINRALKLGGEIVASIVGLPNILEFSARDYVRRAEGKTKPVDGTAGYTRGSIFTRATDDAVGNTGPRMYINIGNYLKCKFVPVVFLTKQIIETFDSIPTIVKNDGYSTPTGTAGDINVLQTPKNKFEYCIKGTQTILAPTFSANGLNLTLDQTDNDGIEITNGVTSRSPVAFTVGTDPAFYMSATLKIADVSGTDDCAFGFRKAEAYQANVDDYDEMAALNVISGDVKLETILNNAATVTTDTTVDVADNGTVVLTVKVAADGLVTVEVNGAAVAGMPSFRFDAGEVVVPFGFVLNASDVCDTLYLQNWEVGYQ